LLLANWLVSQSPTWLIARVVLAIKAAMVVSWMMPSNTSNNVALIPSPATPTPQLPEPASTPPPTLVPRSPDTQMSLPEASQPSKLLLPMLVQSLSLLMLHKAPSNSTVEVSTMSQLAAALNSTMVSSPLDTELTADLTTGWSRTHGEPHGVFKDTS